MATEPRGSSVDGTIVDTEAQSQAPDATPSPKDAIAKLDDPKLEHDQLEHSDPTLHQALTENNAYLHRRDEHGSYLIRATKDDKTNPRNWPNWKRYAVVGLAAWLNNMACLCVSGYSTGAEQLTEEFGVSAEIGTLGLSLFILGFALGELGVGPVCPLVCCYVRVAVLLKRQLVVVHRTDVCRSVEVSVIHCSLFSTTKVANS